MLDNIENNKDWKSAASHNVKSRNANSKFFVLGSQQTLEIEAGSKLEFDEWT